MAKDQQELAGFVKSVHAHLREDFYRNGNFEEVWDNHCHNIGLLSDYADAMHHLATDHWNKKPETRIDWCKDICLEYFHQGGLIKVRDKLQRKKEFDEMNYTKKENKANKNEVLSVPVSVENQCEDIVEAKEAVTGKKRSSIHKTRLKRVETSSSLNSQEYLDNLLSSSPRSEDRQYQRPYAVKLQHADNPVSLPKDSDVPGANKKCQEFLDNQWISEAELPGSMTSSSEMTLTIEDDPETVYAKYGPTSYNTISQPFLGKIRLLDVGSCYNPFFQYEDFLSIGIDISPAVESVFRCDFLHLDMMEPLQLASDSMETYVAGLRSPVRRLPRDSFHVVVFSLLLEYFPSTYQRWICCQKAHELLMHEGLLLIITPDSGHVGRNANMMKSWKAAIQSLGFKRWRYVKQEHLHCMAFRKVSDSTIDSSTSLLGEAGPDMLFIPQDLSHRNKFSKQLNSDEHSNEDEQFLRENFNILPGFSD